MTKQNSKDLKNISNDAALSQKRHRILYEHSLDAVIVSTPDGSILDFNHAALTFLGLSKSEITESNITTFYANRSDRTALIEQVNGKGVVHNAPIIFLDQNKQVKHCLVTSMRLTDLEGAVYGYQTIIRDVTKHRLAQKKLHHQKSYAEKLIHLAPAAISIVDLDGGIIRVNEEFCRLFQYSEKMCIDRTIDELIVPEHLKSEYFSFLARAVGGEYFEEESIRNKKDGTLLDVSILAKPIATELDEPAVYVIYRDISKRKQDQEALRISEARHRTVLEAAPDPVIVLYMDSRVSYLNPAFARVFGWRLDDCLNKTIDFVPEKNEPETEFFMDQIRNGDSFSGVETQRFTKEGKLVDVSISGAVFFDGNGNPEGFINTLQDISERRQKDKELRYIAFHDILTALPNRKSFYICLEDLLQHSGRRNSDRVWALMFLDLDTFKQVNDALGHDTGDQLLKEVAVRLKNCLRETDHLFRLGGDEFTIILTNLNRDIDVARVARKILEIISRPFRFNSHEIFTSTSIGISVFPNDGWDVEVLVKNADIAMYEAKEKGGNNYRFFTEEMNRKAQHRMKLESSLRKALDRNELRLYYQPLVNKESHIEGMEALLRWQHPELGLIFPGDFIRITEETGIIVPVGKWVLETACMQTKRWHDMGFTELFVSVNLSARQLQEPDFEQMVVSIIEKTDLPPSSLKLEVIEGSMIRNPDVCIKKMKFLRSKGISFSIDDFGTGYSSLSYLKRFPIDALKIDRSFIIDSIKSKGDREIVKTILAMAKNLNIDAIAKGVETNEQKEFLISYGCNNMQGFLFSQPLPVEAFKKLLEKQKKNFASPFNIMDSSNDALSPLKKEK